MPHLVSSIDEKLELQMYLKLSHSLDHNALYCAEVYCFARDHDRRQAMETGLII